MLSSVIVLASGEAGYNYKQPSGGNSDGQSSPGEVANADNYVPQVYKHVYVHSAPDEMDQEEKRVIRVPGGDKHVNIIFVKAPSQSSQAQTEVILPDQDEHKVCGYLIICNLGC